MFARNVIMRVTLILAATLGLSAFVHAETFSDRLKKDPTAIERPKDTIMPGDAEVTRSLRAADEPDVYATLTCSYDSYYWNTIYACDPEHQGRPEFEKRGGEPIVQPAPQ